VGSGKGGIGDSVELEQMGDEWRDMVSVRGLARVKVVVVAVVMAAVCGGGEVWFDDVESGRAGRTGWIFVRLMIRLLILGGFEYIGFGCRSSLAILYKGAVGAGTVM
jgi:hypothetical protein